MVGHAQPGKLKPGVLDLEEREGEREAERDGEREFALEVLRLAGVLVVGTDAVNQEMGMRWQGTGNPNGQQRGGQSIHRARMPGFSPISAKFIARPPPAPASGSCTLACAAPASSASPLA